MVTKLLLLPQGGRDEGEGDVINPYGRLYRG